VLLRSAKLVVYPRQWCFNGEDAVLGQGGFNTFRIRSNRQRKFLIELAIRRLGIALLLVFRMDLQFPIDSLDADFVWAILADVKSETETFAILPRDLAALLNQRTLQIAQPLLHFLVVGHIAVVLLLLLVLQKLVAAALWRKLVVAAGAAGVMSGLGCVMTGRHC